MAGRFSTRSVAIAAAALVGGVVALRGLARRRRRARDEGASAVAARAHIHKIVLTGGPCAGKTTALSRLASFLRERGFRVYTVPEAATMLFMSGVAFADLDGEPRVRAFQRALLSTQVAVEDAFEGIARSTGSPACLLCDRGAMDGSAYCGDATWVAVRTACGVATGDVELREGRYDAVLHLVTAADGAERFYSLENNDARSEPASLARELDRKTQAAWQGHPRHLVFDNRDADFEHKLRRIVDAVARLVGLPTTARAARKFVFARAPTRADMAAHGVDTQTFTVLKTYLRAPVEVGGPSGAPAGGGVPPTHYSFVRKRTQVETGHAAHGLTTVHNDRDTGARIEKKRILSLREYQALLLSADPARLPVRQTRVAFIWKHQSFIVHEYEEPRAGLCVLHCQTQTGKGRAASSRTLMGDGPESADEQAAPLEMPPFIEAGDEIDDEHASYSGYHLSLAARRTSSFQRAMSLSSEMGP